MVAQKSKGRSSVEEGDLANFLRKLTGILVEPAADVSRAIDIGRLSRLSFSALTSLNKRRLDRVEHPVSFEMREGVCRENRKEDEDVSMPRPNKIEICVWTRIG